MIYINYICNGCGLYTNYAGKNQKQLNILKVDMTNYLILSSATKLKEPIVSLHFCDKCFASYVSRYHHPAYARQVCNQNYQTNKCYK